LDSPPVVIRISLRQVGHVNANVVALEFHKQSYETSCTLSFNQPYTKLSFSSRFSARAM
jgi:hypothetical protein